MAVARSNWGSKWSTNRDTYASPSGSNAQRGATTSKTSTSGSPPVASSAAASSRVSETAKPRTKEELTQALAKAKIAWLSANASDDPNKKQVMEEAHKLADELRKAGADETAANGQAKTQQANQNAVSAHTGHGTGANASNGGASPTKDGRGATGAISGGQGVTVILGNGTSTRSATTTGRVTSTRSGASQPSTVKPRSKAELTQELANAKLAWLSANASDAPNKQQLMQDAHKRADELRQAGADENTANNQVKTTLTNQLAQQKVIWLRANDANDTKGEAAAHKEAERLRAMGADEEQANQLAAAIHASKGSTGTHTGTGGGGANVSGGGAGGTGKTTGTPVTGTGSKGVTVTVGKGPSTTGGAVSGTGTTGTAAVPAGYKWVRDLLPGDLIHWDSSAPQGQNLTIGNDKYNVKLTNYTVVGDKTYVDPNALPIGRIRDYLTPEQQKHLGWNGAAGVPTYYGVDIPTALVSKDSVGWASKDVLNTLRQGYVPVTGYLQQSTEIAGAYWDQANRSVSVAVGNSQNPVRQPLGDIKLLGGSSWAKPSDIDTALRALKGSINEARNTMVRVAQQVGASGEVVNQIRNGDARGIQWLADQIVGRKIAYWDAKVQQGDQAANAYDDAVFNPLRKLRSVDMAPALNKAFQTASTIEAQMYKLVQARSEYWDNYLAGKSTAAAQTKAADARAVLDKLGVKSNLWAKETDWAIFAGRKQELSRFESAYKNYWQALLDRNEPALNDAERMLKHSRVSMGSEPAQAIEKVYVQKLKDAYLAAYGSTSNSDTVRSANMAKVAWWRDHYSTTTTDAWEQEWKLQHSSGAGDKEFMVHGVDVSRIFTRGEARALRETALNEGPGFAWASGGVPRRWAHNEWDETYWNGGIISFNYPTGGAGALFHEAMKDPVTEKSFREIFAKHIQERKRESAEEQINNFVSKFKASEEGDLGWFIRFVTNGEEVNPQPHQTRLPALNADWKSGFTEWLDTDAMKMKQLEAVRDTYVKLAEDASKKLGITSERGFAFMFDTIVQGSGMGGHFVRLVQKNFEGGLEAFQNMKGGDAARIQWLFDHSDYAFVRAERRPNFLQGGASSLSFDKPWDQ